ncbi:hypothetical protein [Streptomyces ziwulingensis]|uniref:Uncharacterized protein n=1 Tax=Streptomyces ziwulingensis TaxID=1045501 RepID=A0ABP9CZX8_9ACTN
MNQIALFPLTALQTKGYAQPEPHDTETDIEVEQATDIEDAA